ncbi:hypothetical protein EMMF5_004133 [Cystobasidiomycetes sp. EMM_F5]
MANTHGDIEKSSIGESKDVYIHNYKDENSHPEHVTQVEARLSEYAKHIDDIEFTEEESRRVGRKMDINLMALLLGLQISFYLDKSNIGNANTAGMSVALGLTSAQYTALLTIFYCVYLCFQWQVVLFKVFPVHIWVAFAAVGWGTASVAQVRAIDSLGDPHLSEPFPTFHRQAATTSQRSLCAESFWPFLKLVGDFVNARTPSSVAG